MLHFFSCSYIPACAVVARCNVIKLYIMTSRILNRFNIKADRLLRSLATDKLSCDIHPRKMIKMVRRVSRDHIIMSSNILDTILLWYQNVR